jgi:hypothetical protein
MASKKSDFRSGLCIPDRGFVFVPMVHYSRYCEVDSSTGYQPVSPSRASEIEIEDRAYLERVIEGISDLLFLIPQFISVLLVFICINDIGFRFAV